MDKKVTLSILTYYDSKIKEWAVSLVDQSLESLGGIFTIRGVIDTIDNLPTELNTVGDVYLVGPNEDGGYSEYVWIDTNKWELIGTTTSTEVTGGVSEQELYAGSDNTGTPENPAEGTVLYAFSEALKEYIETISGSEFTSEEKEKLAGIAEGAEVNVQADWNETDNNSDAFIKNKPTTIAGYGITDAYTKEEVDGKLTGAFHYKGTVATEENLPTEGNIQGDVYNVESTGANYAWNGTSWDKLSETIDLSGYLTREEANETYSTKEYVNELDSSNVKYTEDNNIELKNHIVTPFGSGLYGNSPDNGWTNLAAVKGYNLDTEEEIIQTEIGSTTLHTTISSKDRPNIDTAKGQEEIAYLSDIEKEVFFIQIPIRTLQDKVYTQEEILKWFGVEDIPELKTKIAGNYLPILKYGISLSYNPHYYKMIVEYLAFESANQIKMVFGGLDTSNDVSTKYEIIINLDGTIIEGNSNIKLSTLDLINTIELEELRTEIENINELEII